MDTWLARALARRQAETLFTGREPEGDRKRLAELAGAPIPIPADLAAGEFVVSGARFNSCI